MHVRALVLFLAFLFVSVAAIWVPPGGAPNPNAAPVNAGDTAWMLTAAALVLLMTPGLSFFYGGMVRRKNVISTMLQSFVAMGVVSLIWIVVGFSLAFGESIGGVIGNPMTYLMFRGVGGETNAALSPTVPLLIFALFQLKFAIITPALITGSFAERVRFSSYMIFLGLFTVFIYCPLAHLTWHPEGLLRQFGVLDFAGGTVVHMSAGIAALAGAIVLGPRHDHKAGHAHPPAHLPYVLLGTGMLWFGWFGFNAGSAVAAGGTAALAFTNTNTASASAMLGWMLFDRVRGLKPSALGACIGAVVGLVAITPAAGYVPVGASIFIGLGAAIASNLAIQRRSRMALDDTLDVFPCHGIGGIFGMVATGMFASAAVNSSGADGLIYGGTTLFSHHLIALTGVTVFVFVGSYLLYKLTDIISPLRVSRDQEIQGLDKSQHGESIDADAGTMTTSDLPPVAASSLATSGITAQA